MEKLKNKLNKLEETGVSGAVPLDVRKDMKDKLEDAESGAEKAHRRAVKASVKADEAAKTIDDLIPGFKSDQEPPKKA